MIQNKNKIMILLLCRFGSNIKYGKNIMDLTIIYRNRYLIPEFQP